MNMANMLLNNCDCGMKFFIMAVNKNELKLNINDP